MDSDRSKLPQKYKNWLTAIARVFHNGDEDAAWKELLQTSQENERRWGTSGSASPAKAKIHLKASKP